MPRVVFNLGWWPLIARGSVFGTLGTRSGSMTLKRHSALT